MIVLVDSRAVDGDRCRQGTKLDLAVDAALRLIRTALATGDRCGLGVFDNEVRGIRGRSSGTGAMPTFVAALYALESRWRESDFSPMFATIQARQPKRSLIILLSDIVDVETSRRYRESLVKLAQRHVVLLAALQTPLLAELVAVPVEVLADGFKKGVMFRLLRQRSRRFTSCAAAGFTSSTSSRRSWRPPDQPVHRPCGSRIFCSGTVERSGGPPDRVWAGRARLGRVLFRFSPWRKYKIQARRSAPAKAKRAGLPRLLCRK